ncbi:hypothetical protein LXN10_03385 [Arcobacter sp. KX21116]|uniref:hypothetical protein n=1 Tax=Arcobacter iocasae TaxID=2906515 RepID=UPI0035D40578
MLDAVNIIYILTIVLVLNKYYHISNLYQIILLLHLFSIFLFNGFLIDSSLMPDQFNYFEVTQNIRMFDFLNESNFANGKTVYISGLIFGLFPIPFIDSLYSIGMINYILYLFIFLFLYKKRFLSSRFIVYFYLLYPSLLLYSSLALRDMLIFTIMFFATYYILIVKKGLVGFGSIFLLQFIKFQNLLIYVVALITSILLSPKNNKYNFIFFIIAFAPILFLLDFFTIEKLNYYRLAFYNENLLSVHEPYIPISSYFDLLLSIIPSIMMQLFRPLPWEEFGILQLLQFSENCVIFILILYILKENFKYKLWKMQEIKFLNVLLFLALLIYGLVSYNSGTAVRYKFPFIGIYIIYSFYFIYQKKQLIKKSSLCVE